MSLSTQQTLKSLAMTPEFEKRFAAANGVIVPSKVPQGEQPQKKRPMRVEKPTWEKKAKMTCIICGSARRDLRGLRDHFVVCVGRNGNPNGACWDDSLNPDYAANKSSSHTSTSLKDSAPAAALSNEHLAKLKRHRKTEECLAAVNGIVIQSKLSAGQAPNQGDYERNERQVHPCIICDRRFATRDQVGLHFSACVKRNGNPNGARWNDAWNSAASPVGHTGTQSSFGSNLQDLLTGEYELEDAQYDGPEMDSFLPNVFAVDPQRVSAPPGGLPQFHPGLQQIDPSLVNLVPNAVQPYDPYTIHPTSQPNFSLQAGMGPYNLQPPMEHWTNHALLSTLQGWQDMIDSGDEQYAQEHPDFQELMEELIKRDLVTLDWRWTVNIEDVNMNLTRAVAEDSRF